MGLAVFVLLLTALSGLASSQHQTITTDDALHIMRDVATAEIAAASQTSEGFADLEHVLEGPHGRIATLGRGRLI